MSTSGKGTKKQVKRAAAKKRKNLVGISKKIKNGILSIVPDFKDENEFWRLKSTHGRDKIFGTPTIMLEAAKEYFDSVKKRPFKKEEWKSTKHGLRKVHTKVYPPYTMEAMCIFMGVSTAYFRMFRAQLKRTDPQYVGFITAIDLITDCIRNNKYEGAVVGKFKENIIAYDLGLKKDHDGAVAQGGLIINVESAKSKLLIDEVRSKLQSIDDGYEQDRIN